MIPTVRVSLKDQLLRHHYSRRNNQPNLRRHDHPYPRLLINLVQCQHLHQASSHLLHQVPCQAHLTCQVSCRLTNPPLLQIHPHNPLRSHRLNHLSHYRLQHFRPQTRRWPRPLNHLGHYPRPLNRLDHYPRQCSHLDHCSHRYSHQDHYHHQHSHRPDDFYHFHVRQREGSEPE